MDPARPAPPADDDSPAAPEPADADLVAGLTSLAGLSVARLSLGELLSRVASVAVQAIPGADGAGLTLQEPDRPDIVVGSAAFVEAVDDIQYGGGEGPCISAAATGQTMRSRSVERDQRWPEFGPRAGSLGVRSVLSLPLFADEDIVGSMNMYAHPEDAFDDRAERNGQTFAESAAVTAQNAQVLAQTQRATAKMQDLLTSRAVINQAVGMLVAGTGCTADEALHRLDTWSQIEHRSVSEVATSIVEATTRRARERLRRT